MANEEKKEAKKEFIVIKNQKKADEILDMGVQPIGFTQSEATGEKTFTFLRKTLEAAGIKVEEK